MELYRFTNKISGKVYIGISKDARKRRYTHMYNVRSGTKTPFYAAYRKYGEDAFTFEILHTGLTEEQASELEIQMIAEATAQGICYNLHRGGHIGFDVSTKDPESVASWKNKMKKARAGKKPALGMKHTDDNKELFGMYGKLRWDMYGRYPEEVLDLSFTEANKKYGISKTHYYRLRKSRALSNEQG